MANLVDPAEPFFHRKVQAINPDCMQSVDVSSYFLVAPMTLRQISVLYWNLYAVIARAEISTQTTRLIKEDDLRLVSYDPVLNKQPKERLCSSAVSEVSLETVYPENYPSGEYAAGFWSADVGSSTTWNVVKMYNGDTTEELNFLGYGISAEEDFNPFSDYYGFYTGELAFASCGPADGQPRDRILKVITSYCKYDPNPEIPYELGGEEEQWFSRFCIPGITGCTAEEVSLSGGTLGSFPFVQLSWDETMSESNPEINGIAEILGLEFYKYDGLFISNVQTDDSPPEDERPLITIPTTYQVLYLTGAIGPFGGYLGEFPFPTNYNPEDRIDYESILYAEYKSLEIYGDVYPSDPRKDAFEDLRREFYNLRNFFGVNAYEELFEGGTVTYPPLPFLYNGFILTPVKSSTFEG